MSAGDEKYLIPGVRGYTGMNLTRGPSFPITAQLASCYSGKGVSRVPSYMLRQIIEDYEEIEANVQSYSEHLRDEIGYLKEVIENYCEEDVKLGVREELAARLRMRFTVRVA